MEELKSFANGDVIVSLDPEAFEFFIDVAICPESPRWLSAYGKALIWAAKRGYVLDDPEEQEHREHVFGYRRLWLVPALPVDL